MRHRHRMALLISPLADPEPAAFSIRSSLPPPRVSAMALVYSSFDPLHCPQHQSHPDFTESRQTDPFASFPSTVAGDIQPDYSANPHSIFNSYSALTPQYAHDSLFDAPSLVLEGFDDMPDQTPQRYTPSASPATTLSHSCDYIPSNTSPTSGTSGQSIALSAAGSPYHQAQPGLSNHEQWAGSQNGTAVATGISPSDAFGPDVFSPRTVEANRFLYDAEHEFMGSFVGGCFIVLTPANSCHLPICR